MTHDWKLIKTTKYDGCSDREQNNVFFEIRECSQCGEEITTNYGLFTTTIFAGGGECTGVYPIKVRIV